MLNKCNGTGNNFFSILSETMSYLYGNFIDLEVNLIVMKSGYVKGYISYFRDYNMEGNFITLNKDARNRLHHIVVNQKFVRSKKPRYNFVFI